jgi:hypothetical protein
MRIKANGAYLTEQAVSVTSVSSVGLFTTLIAHGYSVGDWVFDNGNSGFSGLTWIVATVPSGTTFTVTDLFGTPVSSVTASIGGSVSRIYTVVAPYAAVDLPWLKYTQSADTLSLTCLNQDTQVSYPPYDLVRNGNTNWAFNSIAFTASVGAPTGVAATAASSTTVDTWYAYVVTAVSSSGEESIASSIVEVKNNDIALAQGSNTITWTAVPGAQYYNVYGSVPSYTDPVPYASSFGFMGRALGPSFVDTNVIPDFTQTPPIHTNPFIGGQILNVVITNGGTGYTQSTAAYVVTTSTGSQFNGFPIVSSGGSVVGFIIQNPGQGYAPGDTIALTGGTGGTASLSIGPASGNYPSVPAYYQSRRVYAATVNQPDTYWMSKPGLFTNFDISIPINDGDSLSGTPWAQQVNGIQFLVPMPGGLVVLTGNGAWQVNGGSQAAITPSTQTATPQAYNGCSATVPPLTVNYDILYVQAKGATVRDLAYNFFVNIYTGTDLTVLSNHLFTDYQIVQWAWCEEPYKLVWLVRDDGSLLSLTYVKEQDVYSWSRHDTNGLFVGVCSITEPPVDAAYFITQRFVRGAWRYYSERMDNRLWNNVEDAFCVDAGLETTSTPGTGILSSSTITGNTVFTTNTPAFSSFSIGTVIRAAGGVATVTGYNSSVSVNATWTIDPVLLIQDNTSPVMVPQAPGTWNSYALISTVTGLNHLEGLTVTGLADGSVIPPQTVVNGSITLEQPASKIVIGLGYTCQAQTMYIDHPTREGNTIQNRRKVIQSVGLRVEASRGLQLGSDQPDSSAQQFYAPTTWTYMNEIKERTNSVHAGNAVPLFTGDYYKNIDSQWGVEGQVAVQQIYPLPANVLSVISYFETGDDQ